MAELYEIRVYGMPAPQGSKTFMGMSKTGLPMMGDAGHKKLRPWRNEVEAAARTMVEAHVPRDTVLIVGPVTIYCYFTMPRPAYLKKRLDVWPHSKPDGDKLLRSTWDALKNARVYEDDSRIVKWSGMKLYPGQGPDAMDRPGVIIRVRAAFPPPQNREDLRAIQIT